MTQISTITAKHSKPFFTPGVVTKEGCMEEMFQRVVHHDDLPAFEQIFHKTYKSLCMLSGRMVKSIEIAEEIVDDVFYHLWKNRKRIAIKTSFASYLLVAVRNRSLDCLRKMKNKENITVELTPEASDDQTIAQDMLVYEELQQRIQHAIQTLPPQCRLIFLMSRDQEFTYNEIALKLGLSIKTVDTQMGRALKHLRIEMKDLLM